MLRILMALYIPFLILYWLLLAGMVVLLGVFFIGSSHFKLFWAMLIFWLGATLVHTIWAARVLLKPAKREEDPLEIKVPAEGIAELWAMTKHVAQERELPLPDEIRLHPATVAHVYEDDEGDRILVLGGLSLTMMSERALAGVIAHELGHFGAGDTKLSKAGYKQGLLMFELECCFASQRYAMVNPLVWVVRGYHWLYLLVQRLHSREQEFAADEHDAAQAGKQETAASLIYLDVIEELPWTRLSSVLESHAETGQRLDNMFAEQRERARSIDRDEWENAMRKALKKETGLLDSHPCLRERLKAVGVSPKKALGYALERSGPPIADRLRAWPGIEKRMTSQLMVIYRQMQQDKMELAQIIRSVGRVS
jgi:Zn-dependent protease with chaperone function